MQDTKVKAKADWVTPSVSMPRADLERLDRFWEGREGWSRARVVRDACRLYLSLHERGLMEIVTKIVQSRDEPTSTPGGEEVA